MESMKERNIKMEMVIDEYGGKEGMVQMEEIVEMVVGDIEEENEEEEIMIEEDEDGVLVVDEREDMEEMEERIGKGLEVGENGEEVEKVGGIIL